MPYQMLNNNYYNIDKTFDYDIIKAIVFTSLEKIAKEEASKNKPDILRIIAAFLIILTTLPRLRSLHHY
jgi:hypothetical protein